jgi:hypothetical protein
MYYNNNENILVPRVPKNLIKPDGSIFINFNNSDTDILSDYGYYTVRADNNIAPDNNHTEDESKRIIVLDKPYADITRTWTTNNPPEQQPTLVEIPQDITDPEL